MQPEARSWRHSSIASRSRFLLQLAEDPRRTKHFERVVRLVQAAILLSAVAASVWAAQELHIWALLGQKVVVPLGRLLVH